MNLGTILLVVVLIFAILLALSVIPNTAVVVGLLIGSICVALLLRDLR